jgi:hypothetical protein
MKEFMLNSLSIIIILIAVCLYTFENCNENLHKRTLSDLVKKQIESSNKKLKCTCEVEK